MSIATVVTRGYGSFGSIADVVVRGYLPAVEVVFYVPYDVDQHDDSSYAALGTAGANTALNSSTFCQGTGSYEFSPSGTSLSANTVSYPYASQYILSGAFIIEGRIRFKDLTETAQVFISFYDNVGDHRSFYIGRSGGNLTAFVSDDGTSASPAVLLQGAATFDTTDWHHVALSKDGSNNLRLFYDGTEVANGAAAYPLADPINENLILGGLNSTTDLFFYGYLDDWKITINQAYTSNFTPTACVVSGGQSYIPTIRRRRR